MWEVGTAAAAAARPPKDRGLGANLAPWRGYPQKYRRAVSESAAFPFPPPPSRPNFDFCVSHRCHSPATTGTFRAPARSAPPSHQRSASPNRSATLVSPSFPSPHPHPKHQRHRYGHHHLPDPPSPLSKTLRLRRHDADDDESPWDDLLPGSTTGCFGTDRRVITGWDGGKSGWLSNARPGADFVSLPVPCLDRSWRTRAG